MTTPLTIYRFGLCGNSANESIGNHRFWTKKHQKVNKSSQKTTPNRFGTQRSWVRIPSPRPKNAGNCLNFLHFLFVFSIFLPLFTAYQILRADGVGHPLPLWHPSYIEQNCSSLCSFPPSSFQFSSTLNL